MHYLDMKNGSFVIARLARLMREFIFSIELKEFKWRFVLLSSIIYVLF